MIKKDTFSLDSDSLKIYYDIYLDSRFNTYKAIVQIAHGMVEHRGRYNFIASKLAEEGYVVAINDHRGHGDSIGGDIYLGEMGENGFERAVSDMYNLHLELKRRFTSKKFILIGHSMGSLLSRRFLQKYQNDIDMLILCGTPSPQKFISLGIVALKILRFLGLNNIGKNLANRLSFITFNAKYKKIDKLDSGSPSGSLWINRDESEVLKYINDKKSRFVFSINSFINLLRGLKEVFSTYPNNTINSKLPILFISGEDDACGEFGVGALQALKHINSQGYNNTKLILYAGARHELFLELNKDEVLRDIMQWIESNLDS
ncbi:alpha/beta fold hydrolase [Helicobacter sp. MIT 14-3879]|uniref:alpha/beta fold hydrolase n=1 Tax=Helicobacter sp. MIT 14-3879 TaxID=2040649 RepID=UPI000E1E5360|nr:alpha/beta hydrolase [Helicobacter sp. MIT 14-3879]RDU65527.1 alpha/beta hydrolase [Helicobacter sp. MIT 14-3879]